MSDDIKNHRDKKATRRFPIEHWMVCCEWDEVVDVPRQDGIVGEPQRYIKKNKANQTIDVHPIVFGISMLQQGIMNFVITFAMPIPKVYFDLVTAPTPTEQRVDEIATKVENELANPTSETLRETIQDQIKLGASLQ